MAEQSTTTPPPAEAESHPPSVQASSQELDSPQQTQPTETEAPVKAAETSPETTSTPEEETGVPLPETLTKETKPMEEQSPQVTEAAALAAAEDVSLVAAMEKEVRSGEAADEKAPAGFDEEKTNMIPQNLGSFKEESNKLSDLSDSESKSLDELKQLVRDALNNHLFGSNRKPEDDTPEEISIWGITLLKDERSDVVLLKFLRARDFKVKDSFTMLKNTIQWRRDFKIDELVEEDIVDDLDKVVFMHGNDREGHPVCYNVYGEFQNKELYHKTFADEEKRKYFLRTRIQFLEKSIRKLDFSPGGVSTIFQINDMKNSPGFGKTELRLATKKAVQLLQDNYPEFVFKQVFVNVPWWYLAFYTMISPFMTPRSKSKLVFAGPTRSAETLFKYISPEQVPIQYGGLSVDSCDCNPDFTMADPATEITVKPGTKQTVEIIIYEKCVIVWEIRVVGWEVSYTAEFMPEASDAYTVVIQKPRKMGPLDEPVISQSFKVSDLGKLLLTVNNPTTKKKKLVYRFKVKPLD